jgi:prepilin-type N-terminal cleavage/methylation domain-containing protein
MRSDKGFTLIELVITIVIIGIIAYVAAQALSSGTRAFFSVDFRKEALDQSRISMERMMREIRMLRDSSSVVASSSTQFSFTDVNGVAVDFNWVNPNITRNGNTLAENISELSFGYLRSDGTVDAAFSAANTKRIRISMVATVYGENVQLQSEAFLRNL